MSVLNKAIKKSKRHGRNVKITIKPAEGAVLNINAPQVTN